MSYFERRQQVQAYRNAELIRLQKLPGRKAYKQARKTYNQTEAYIHLTLKERRAFISDLAKCVSGWGFPRSTNNRHNDYGNCNLRD
jgi:hypothetical protein